MMPMAPDRPLTRTVLASLILAAALSACTGGSDDPPPRAAATMPSTPDALPPTTVDQFHELLAQLEGTPVVVNAWASWCEPCKTETPKLVEAAGADPDVQFLGIDTMDAREGAEGFIAEHRVPYPSVFDPDGAILTALNGIGPPITVFYEADGTVEGTVAGELSQAALDEHLAAIKE
jgi:thiol:disulfide interchange protein